MSPANELGPALHFRVQAIVRAVAREYELPGVVLMGRRRDRNIVEARQVAMYALRDQLGMTYAQIGRYFEKEHGTVIHACEQVETYFASDARFRERWPALVNRIFAARLAAEKGLCLDYREAVA